MFHRVRDRRDGGDVLDDAPDVDGQGGRLGYDAPDRRVDLVLLGALRVEDGKDDDLDVAVDVRKRLLQRGDRLGLVRLDGEADGASAQDLA